MFYVIIMLNEMHSISQASKSLQNNWYFLVMVTYVQFVSLFVFL
jgi:hypothetical protein